MSTLPTSLDIKVGIGIAKRPEQVFEGIADPAQLCNYFIATSTGRMEEGALLTWSFAEFDLLFPVQVGKVVPNESIAFSWEDLDGTTTGVTITLQPAGEDATYVSVTEGSRAADAAGLKWLAQNTEGWANFLCCLKAWLEYGINLRKGAFSTPKLPIEESTTEKASLQ